MPDEARIRVKAEGTEEAVQNLGSVEEALEQLDQTGQQSAAGIGAAGKATGDVSDATGEATDGVKKLAGAKGDAGEQAKKLAQGIASQLNPEIGSMVGLITNGIEGLANLSSGLLGVAAGAAGVTAVAAVFTQLAEQASRAAAELERVQALQREQRLEGLDARTSVATQLTEAGVDPASTQRVLNETQRLAESGVVSEVAEQASIAAVLAQGLGQNVSSDDAARAIVGRRLQPFDLDDREEFLKQLQEGLEFARGERAGFVDSFFQQTAATARLNAPTDLETAGDESARFQTALDAELAKLQRERPELADDAIARIRELASTGPEAADQARLNFQQLESVAARAGAPGRRFLEAEADRAFLALAAARNAQDVAQFPTPGDGGEPQVVNIYNNTTNQNVGTHYGLDPFSSFRTPKISPDSAVLE